jgi:tRNA (adenine57-N1/adenine58-N1)-methyltransferase catalytic subunit
VYDSIFAINTFLVGKESCKWLMCHFLNRTKCVDCIYSSRTVQCVPTFFCVQTNMDDVLVKDSVSKFGDFCILYASYDAIFTIKLTPDGQLNCRYGSYFHKEIVGKQYGSKIKPKTGSGYMYLLRVSPSIWATALKQRTQIIQPSDQALIISLLWLRPGSVVVESGTGSGALTIAFARTVAPSGHVHTFEFNEMRANIAKSEFKDINIDALATVEHGDACAPGGFGTVPDGAADAVLLDVPNPWKAIENANRVLKPSGRICTYSPCIEQVQKTYKVLQDFGFRSIKTIEVRLRNFCVKTDEVAVPGFQATESKKIEDSSASTAIPSAPLGKKRKRHQPSETKSYRKIVRARPFSNTRGHTAFLTFASKLANE